jgi:hypothetical protein
VRKQAELIAAVVACIALTGCNEDKQNADGSLSSESAGRSMSVIGSLRPKADPNVIEKIHQEEAEARRKQEEALAAQQKALQQQNQASDPANRDLPAVDQNPISGIASALGFNTTPASNGGTSPAMNPMASQSAGVPTMSGGGMAMAPSPPPTASYGGGYPSMGGGGMIPPPPAVSLTTDAQRYQAPVDPNYMAYMNQGAYGGGYGGYPPPGQYQPPVQMPAHPAGSMFSNGGAGGGSAAPAEDKKKPLPALITPTGMEPRSNYKQRDDLKVLVKGALAFAPNPELRDPKNAAILTRTDVGLPSEATRGNLSLTPRQMAMLFKNPPLDKRIAPLVYKVEQEVAQSYYRYLYAYNKYMLTQQQVAARKQEMDVADSAAERQRAAADLSTAQQEADASKDDMRAAQTDLASSAGPQAARSIITRVSGVAPSADALAVAQDPSADQARAGEGGFLGSVQNAFGALNFWGKGKKEGGESEKVASVPVDKPQKDKKEDKKDKKDKKKGGKDGGSQTIASSPVRESSSASTPDPTPAAAAPAPSPSSPISFELKNVQTTPRKSVLKVAVRNNGGDSISVDADSISVAEGDKRLAEASVLTQFDQTLVAPNGEITGTITIFGRPWNDRLTVSLSEGGRTIQLRR